MLEVLMALLLALKRLGSGDWVAGGDMTDQLRCVVLRCEMNRKSGKMSSWHLRRAVEQLPEDLI